jgi:hypothetical protein
VAPLQPMALDHGLVGLVVNPALSGAGVVLLGGHELWMDSYRWLRMQYSLVVINVRTDQYCISEIKTST